ncbi:MAG: glycosyltransferase [Pseudomonas sp.]|nr:MAG: glycosyltransferase [Pseudomonas sp.]
MVADSVFAINGRFLSQIPTGVQRYALNILSALDHQLGGCRATSLLVPHGTLDPGLTHIEFREIGRGFSGHAWEQGPLARDNHDLLLNLCNTAPIARANQIVCVHDANVFAAAASYDRSFRMLYQALQPALVKRAARITTVSQASARQIARYLPIRAEEIAVLPNGHEHALAWRADAAEKAPAVVEASSSRSRQFVMALGSRAQHKNLDLLVRASAALDELGIDIVIAGGDLNIFSATNLGRRSNIKTIGRVSDDDLAFFFKHALCLMFPSFNEGFGLPIVEAMALGCPVLSSYHSSMKEVCGDAALLASPFEPIEWVKHIKRLKTSSSLVSDLRDQGFEQARKFSWKESAKGYLNLMHEPATRLAPTRMAPPAMSRAAVIIATRGRPSLVSQTVRFLLDTQTIAPALVIISCVDISDAGDLVRDGRVRVITGRAGSSAQRNTALADLPEGIDVVAFFDDDFIADRDWLATALQTFSDESQVVGFTGRVVADGIKGPGISFDKAVAILEKASAFEGPAWEEPYSPYGCNMAFKRSAIGYVRFDERLVLYGWLEDRDFAGSLAKQGSSRLIKCGQAYGVHMGVKSGRVSGDRFGYSQIINPVYMRGKGTMTAKQAAAQIMRNILSNLSRSLWPEPFIDRRGRLRGNLIGLSDLIRGRVQPERAATLKGPTRKWTNLAGGNAR